MEIVNIFIQTILQTGIISKFRFFYRNNNFINEIYSFFGVISEAFGNLIVLVASVFAVTARSSLSPGLAGLSISMSLTVNDLI